MPCAKSEGARLSRPTACRRDRRVKRMLSVHHAAACFESFQPCWGRHVFACKFIHRKSSFSSRGSATRVAGRCVKELPRRSMCRSSLSVAIDSGSDVSLLFLRCSSRKRAKRPTESGSNVRRLSDARISIRLLINEIGFGPCFKGVFTDVQVAQSGQPGERRRQRGQLVVVEIEKISQLVEVRQRVRHLSQPVVSQIEHTKFFQAANPAGYFRQLIVGQDQRFEIGSLPHPLGDATKPLFP